MNVAFIPVRGGSKSIPLKNIKSICGRPLIYWTAKAACGSENIDKVYIATDSDEIRKTVEAFANKDNEDIFKKIEIIGRSAATASDTASTESAMLEFAANYDFDNIILIQATSPLLTSADIDKGFNAFNSDNTDSVLSVVRQKRFNWKTDDSGYSLPLNYDIFKRPRRQEFDGYLVENGAFYITSKSALVESKNRISGNIRTVEMSDASYHEIDEVDDWVIAEHLLRRNLKDSHFNPSEIMLFLTDCDGCLTDGGMYYSENGDELKKFNTKDGMGFQLLKERKILTGIITGEGVELNRRRADKLKLDIFEADCKNKLETINDLCSRYDIDISNVCYIGDDINDIEAIRAVGFGCAPADAVDVVKEAASYVTKVRGGEGVIREVADIILRGFESEAVTV